MRGRDEEEEDNRMQIFCTYKFSAFSFHFDLDPNMSPIPTVYNHLNIEQHPHISIPISKSNCENLNLLAQDKSENSQQLNRRFTVTNISIPKQTCSNYSSRLPSSASAMDFRPMITNGRKKFGPIPSSSSMIIIKKKSPPRFNSSIQVRHKTKTKVRQMSIF